MRELDGRDGTRPHWHPFTCGTLAAEIHAPEPLGRLLFVNHIPSWQQDWELEREVQTVAAGRLIEEMLDRGPAHVILAGDLDAEPDSASIRFLTGLQSLGDTSVRFRDAWASTHPGEPGHPFSPANPLVTRPTLDIRSCDRLFDELVDGVWASDHFGVTAELSATLPMGGRCLSSKTSAEPTPRLALPDGTGTAPLAAMYASRSCGCRAATSRLSAS